MNVYDFDGTIFDGDSSRDFYRFCARRHPRLLLCLPRMLWGRVRRNRQAAFCYVPRLPDAAAEVEAYWDSRLGRIKGWYWAQRRASDVIVSAGPAFLLEPAGRRLGVRRVIATQIDTRTGEMKGANCGGAEKAARFLRAFPEPVLEGFWSDHRSDAPMARLAEKAYMVRNDRVEAWPLGPDA